MKLLVLTTDLLFKELLEETLSAHELDFISEATKLRDLNHMKCVFEHDSYDVLVLSNMGIPMPLAMHHVSLLPEVRMYGVLMLSGALSETDQNICTQHQVEAMKVPFGIPELCEVIDRLGWMTHKPAPATASAKPRRARKPARSATSRKRG